ncbi:zeatin o-glucosyltransferase [Phtheirospermum japonicum]|uniref:Glycosyltransferase n=1 Tax=Phtheirospermum japonicum TaxID=374723 RepID=A0A830BLT5_9LAMI|nr:zeatin o-glucosyltransferase [Phtheirospermum japonicum]
MAKPHESQEESHAVAVVMVPLPAQGHLNQLLHLSRLILSAAASLPVFYVGAATHIRQAKLRLHGWDLSNSISNNINFHEFPTPSFQNPQPDPHAPTKFPIQIIPSLSASINLRDPVYGFVNDLSTKYKRVVVIYDSMMAYVVQDIDSVPNAESYCFWSISAFAMYFFQWDKAGRPDLPNVQALSVLDTFPGPDDFFSPEFSQFRSMQRGSRKSFFGDIYNSSRVIEGSYLDLLETGAEKKWVIGPFNPVETNTYPEKKSDTSRIIRHACLDWLDKQGPNSVIFVSFGTTTSISDEQIKELAMGLEKSQQKFIWVLREADKGDIFTGEVRKPVLPEGFEERVRERGIVVRDWAPQLEVLGHSATGGFMSHCGWNSCMESISTGVPMATWPMHSDQPMNAALVKKGLRIGVEVKDWACQDEVVSSGVVESAVRKLMGSKEGDEMRKRAKELGDAVKKSVMEGGIRNKEMDSFITHIIR